VVDDAIVRSRGRSAHGRASARRPATSTASRMPPPSAMPLPAAVACTAPHVPSARPLSPPLASAIAAVSVPAANSPPPKPIERCPDPQQQHGIEGAAKITAEKANTPAAAPKPAIRYGSAWRPSVRAARTESRQRAQREERRQCRGLAYRQFQDFGAVRLQQDILHRKPAVPSANAISTRMEPPD